MLYKIIVLANISTDDKEFQTNADEVVYEHQTIVFKKRILKDNKLVTLLAVPQNCSIVELITI